MPPKSLRQRGFKLALLDLDDLLIPREGKKIPAEITQWVAKAHHAGLALHVISNSKFPSRVQKACATLGITGVAWALKPFPFAYKRAFKTFKVAKKETVVIGDQLFTDILGANWMGIHSILVTPMTPERRPDRKFMRWVERFFVRR